MKGNTMKETKLQRDCRLLRNQIKRLEALREAAIKTLVKCENQLPALHKTHRRLDERRLKLCRYPVSGLAEAKDTPPVPVAHVAEDRSKGDDPVALQGNAGAVPGAGDLDEGIPEFLRRAQETLAPEIAAAAYAVANKHNKIPTEDEKKLVASEKRKVKEEHRQADLTGAKRKWPVTDPKALQAIGVGYLMKGKRK